MNKLFNKIWLNRYFLGFVLLFSYVQSLQYRLLSRRIIDIYVFTPEAALFTFVDVCVLFLIIRRRIGFYEKRQQKLNFFNILKVYVSAMIVYLAFINLLSFLISWVFGTIDRNYSLRQVLFNNFDHLLDTCIYGSFFIAYYLWKKNKADTKKINEFNAALSESKITQLKAQLNPHFLFNNLNVLDQLIEEDKKVASAFLNDFSELYRYVLETSEKALVNLSDELIFAKSYFRMIQHKYGNAYRLEISEGAFENYLIPPLSLQLLLENVVDHNLGKENNPVLIQIDINERIMVSNTLLPKPVQKKYGGRSLKNLEKQYKLLSNESVQIEEQQKKFIVTLPLILK
ncbi:sensor histidine kinase [Gynurincola endophyticus]|uniref:sensor histidine kinase n=1 Tax=Gynurincola endophyticus TaxID=2479004 RepID=UPI000F8CD246|nr:histidine kinase [Gynurincola endophyticus]